MAEAERRTAAVIPLASEYGRYGYKPLTDCLRPVKAFAAKGRNHCLIRHRSLFFSSRLWLTEKFLLSSVE